MSSFDIPESSVPLLHRSDRSTIYHLDATAPGGKQKEAKSFTKLPITQWARVTGH